VRKEVTTAMELRSTPYLPEEEQAADAMVVTLLNPAEASSCHALIGFLADRLRKLDEEPWTLWEEAHPVTAEWIETLDVPRPGQAWLHHLTDRQVSGDIADWPSVGAIG
jgi:hypothetical protein